MALGESRDDNAVLQHPLESRCQRENLAITVQKWGATGWFNLATASTLLFAEKKALGQQGLCRVVYGPQAFEWFVCSR